MRWHGRATLAVGAVLALGAVSSATASAATITNAPNSSAGATALAQSMFQDPSLVTGASFVTHPPQGTPNAVVNGDLSYFPQHGDEFGLLTTGNAQSADDANTSSRTASFNAGKPVRGNTDRDVVVLKVDFNAPTGTNCLSVGSFAFYSEEFPEWVGSAFNDAFIAELDQSTWTTSGSTISAPDNFAFDPSGNEISINATGETAMSAANAAGTTYDGATPLLQAAKTVTPGAHSLFLSIFDQGDEDYDSAVMIDNIVVGAVPNPGEACQPGAEEQNYAMTLTPPSATHPTGTSQSVTARVADADTGEPISGGDVRFTIGGANTASDTGTTDASGETAISYTGANAGDDTLIACFDADDDGEFCEPDEPTASATKHWETPAPVGKPGVMSGEGRLTQTTGNRLDYAYVLDCTKGAAPVKLKGKRGSTAFDVTALSSITCTDDPAVTPSDPAAGFDTMAGEGAGTLGTTPVKVRFRFVDGGPAGTGDSASIEIRNASTDAVLFSKTESPIGAYGGGTRAGRNTAAAPAA